MISGDRSLAEGKRGAFYNTLEEFHKYWERVDIVCPRPDRRSSTANCQLFNNVYIHPSRWPLIFQPWFILAKGEELFKRAGFDLVTVHEYAPFYNGIGARLLFNKIGVPYVLEIHHVPGYPRAANFKERFYCFLSRRFLKCDSKKAAAVRIVNQHELRNFLAQARVDSGKILYIPSMYIDLGIFKPRDLPKKYDLIFAGRLAENKGVNLFIDAVRRLGVKAVIVGDGPLKESLKSKVKSLGLEDDIEFYGWAKDQIEVAELMNQSKILVMSSYNEGGPRVVPEAMACGLPVLATPVGIAADLISKNNAGVLIDWNADDIAKKARRILSDSFEYSRLSRAAIWAAAQFEKKAAIKNYAQVLQKIIK